MTEVTRPTAISDLDSSSLSKTLRPENSPGFLLWQVTNRWQRRLRAKLDPMGLTHVQFVLLAGLGFLQEKQSLTTQARLAHFCRTDPMMTSQVVRVLEREGKLIRRPHPNDSRAKVLELTDAGVALLNQAMPAVLEADQQFFSSLAAGHAGFVHQLRTLLVEPEDQDQEDAS